ncbi:MAG: Ig-like domain-containing protein [Cyanobacteria bacterium J06592_8]
MMFSDLSTVKTIYHTTTLPRQESPESFLNISEIDASTSINEGSNILVVIDAQVEDSENLRKGVIPGAKVILLNSSEDGVRQITQALQENPEISELHLISHGRPGSLQLGNTELSLDTLQHYASELRNWPVSRLILYGCNVAAGDAGTEFIEKLHQLTQAEIAASTTRTGDAALGGDWKLDVKTSDFDVVLALSKETQANYHSVFTSAGESIQLRFFSNDGEIENDDVVGEPPTNITDPVVGEDENGNELIFNFGEGQNLFIQSFQTQDQSDGTEDGRFIAGDVETLNNFQLRRVNNDNPDGPIEGRLQLVWFEGENPQGGEIDLSPQFPPTEQETLMQQVLSGDIINRGTDNVFSNTGNSQGINNNIERIDYFASGGLTVPANPENFGFLILERGGNDPFQIAAITDLDNVDEDGNPDPNGAFQGPSEYGSLLSFTEEDDWGISTDPQLNLQTQVVEEEAGSQVLINTASPDGEIAGIFVSYADLDLEQGDTFFGYSLFPADIEDERNPLDPAIVDVNLVDFASFPTDTPDDDSDQSGGLDLIAGGIVFNLVGENQLPIANPDDVSTPVNTPINIEVLVDNGFGADIDPDSSPEPIAIVPGSIIDPVNGSVVLNNDGTITYTPDPGFDGGQDTFQYTITDGEDESSPATVTVTVTAPPTTVSGTVFTDSDGSDVLDQGEPGIPQITVRLLDSTGEPIPEIPEVETDTDGNYQFANVPSGEYTVQVDAADADLNGAAIGTPNDPTITVAGVPVADIDFGFDRDQIPTTTTISGTVFRDSDGSEVLDPGEPGIEGVEVRLRDRNNDNQQIDQTNTNADGEYTFENVAAGDYDVRVVVNDPDLDGLELTTGNNLVINVGEELVPDINFGFEPVTPPTGQPVTGTVFLDNDGDDADSDEEPGIAGITVRLLDVNQAEVATATTDADGNYEFPNIDDGSYTVQVETTDTDLNGATLGTNNDVAINVAGEPVTNINFGFDPFINTLPDAVDDTQTTEPGAAVTINVLANDTDPENDDLTIESFDQTSPNGGTITQEGQNLVYTPADGFTGPDTFEYTINDGNGNTDTATVTITVNPINTQPDAVEDTQITQQDTPVTVNILENDTDPENDLLVIESFDSISENNGTITLSEDGQSFVYLPAEEFVGVDTFNYTINDGNGGTDTAAVTINILANSLIVDTIVDEIDGDLSLGDVSLREAIAFTNDGGTVTFANSIINQTITLTLGELVVDKSLTIDADIDGDSETRNITLDGAGASRVFNINDGNSEEFKTVNLSGLTITGGSEISDGGGINNQENLSINNSTISGNSSAANAGGFKNLGGTASISNSIISNNSSVLRGGGIENYYGEFNISNTTISGNSSGLSGGGINNRLSSIISISNSTISENISNGDGGGINSYSTVSISNSTISNNSSNSNGGGINNSGEINLNNNTITGNSSFFSGGGVDNGSLGEASIFSTIVAANIGRTISDVQGTFTDNGNNLIGNATGSEDFTVSNLVGDLTNPIDPLLLPLADNGGSTLTQALLIGSPAIDTGSNLNELTTDQRGEGFVREFGEGVDIGAIEFQNQPPVAIEDENFTTDEDTAFTTANVLANDIDPDDNLPLSVTGFDVTTTLGTVTNNEDGTFNYDPNSQFESLAEGDSATDTFTYTIADNVDNPSLEPGTVTITILGVNDTPILVNEIDSQTGTEGLGFVFTVPDNTFDDIDTGDILTLTASNLPSWLTFDVETRTFVGTPGRVDAGTVNITVTATDLQGATVSDSFDLSINDLPIPTTPVANNPPVANDDTFTTNEDTNITAVVLANDTDSENDILSIAGFEISETSGTVTDNGDGTFNYNPNSQFQALAEGETATDTFTYTIVDSAGNLATELGTVTLTIQGVNDVPTLANEIRDRSITPGELIFTIPDNTFNDVDAGDILTLSVADLPSWLTFDSVTGTFTGTPTEENLGTVSITVTATDSFGESVSDTFEITVILDDPSNLPPIANNDGFTTNEDTPFITANILTNDIDPENDPISLVGFDVSGSRGIFTNNGDGTFSYNPNSQFEFLKAGETTTDSFTYTIQDTAGNQSSATVSITLEGVNDIPDAVDDTVIVPFNQFTAINVLANDLDPDNDPLSVTLSTLPTNGTATLTDNIFTYTPNPGFIGSDSFLYNINDGNGGIDTATVILNIVSPGSPIAVDDNASTSVNQPVEINVLLNDSDPDGDPLTINTFDLNSDNGGIITENNGVLVYTPASGFIGDDRFTYTITDGINQDTATVTVSVEAETDEPNDTFPDAIETGLNTNNSNSYFFNSIIGNNFNLSSLVNDVDLFKLQLNAGDWLTVDLDTVSLNSGLDSVLRLFDEAGNQLAISDDNFAPNEANVLESYLGFSAIASGTYYVGVSSFGNSEYSPEVADTDLGSSTGTYNIEIDVTPLFDNLNGSFETGDLRGWQSIGDTFITTEEFGIRPNNGNFHTVLTNRFGSVNTQELENFLNLTPGRLDRITGSIEGSAIQQTVTATAGTQLSFNWQFLTNELLSSNDIGFVSVKSEMQEEIFILENISPNLSLSPTPYGFESLSGNYTFTFPTSGTYTVGIGVVDVSDQILDSALLIDNVSVV